MLRLHARYECQHLIYVHGSDHVDKQLISMGVLALVLSRDHSKVLRFSNTGPRGPVERIERCAGTREQVQFQTLKSVFFCYFRFTSLQVDGI